MRTPVILILLMVVVRLTRFRGMARAMPGFGEDDERMMRGREVLTGSVTIC
jgi:hypothetical protein